MEYRIHFGRCRDCNYEKNVAVRKQKNATKLLGLCGMGYFDGDCGICFILCDILTFENSHLKFGTGLRGIFLHLPSLIYTLRRRPFQAL